RTSKVGYVRATLVGLIASCKGKESLEFLLAELKAGPLGQPRLTAAEELHRLGRPEGLAAMITWWKKGLDHPKLKDEDPASWSNSIAEFPAHSGELEAIQALAKGPRKRRIDVRLTVIDAVGGTPSHFTKPKPPKDPARFAVVVEDLLIAALDDTEERIGE